MLLTSPDGRVSHFPRAWATVTTADGRTGVGWVEWNRNQPSPAESVMVLKSIVLFVLAALLEIGGAWLVWQGVREHRGWLWIGAGVIALGAYGFVARSSPTRTSVGCWRRTAASSSPARWRGE